MKINLNWKIKIAALIFSFFLLYFFFLSAPFKFPRNTIITIEPGMKLRQISKLLKEKNIIRSRFAFEISVVLLGGKRGVLASSYLLEKPLPSYIVAWRLVRWQHNLAPVKITLPEGSSVSEMADIFSQELKNFNKEKFLELALPKEGFLFPDTYFFFLDAKPETVIGQLVGNFENKIGPLKEKIESSGKSLKEIITMASIIEKESADSDERQIVSGILWKRLEKGMPLQVDATFLYINGKGSADLTKDDLNDPSPYNTYRNKGLPPGPIGNPGLDAIIAALYPKESPYFYYLHDKKGKIYFAKTFNEHVRNKKKYL